MSDLKSLEHKRNALEREIKTFMRLHRNKNLPRYGATAEQLYGDALPQLQALQHEFAQADAEYQTAYEQRYDVA